MQRFDRTFSSQEDNKKVQSMTFSDKNIINRQIVQKNKVKILILGAFLLLSAVIVTSFTGKVIFINKIVISCFIIGCVMLMHLSGGEISKHSKN